MGVARDLRFALLKEPYPFPPWGPEGDPPGPEIYSIVDKLAMDKLVRLCEVRLNYRHELQQLQLRYNNQAMELQQKYQKEFMDVLR